MPASEQLISPIITNDMSYSMKQIYKESPLINLSFHGLGVTVDLEIFKISEKSQLL
jgi:hypothetical protein